MSINVFMFLKDKKECPKWLGIGLDGVMQFNYEDKKSCTRVRLCTNVTSRVHNSLLWSLGYMYSSDCFIRVVNILVVAYSGFCLLFK